MKSREAVALAAGQHLQLVEIDVAPPQTGEVLVKITHTGVCHTDAFTLSGDDPEGIFPAVLGQQRAGVVVISGIDAVHNTAKIRDGDTVAVFGFDGIGLAVIQGAKQAKAMRGEIQLDPFVTHTMGLDKINEAFDLMHEEKSIRSVVHF